MLILLGKGGKMVTEYRVQRVAFKWGNGQGYYVIAPTAEAAKRAVATQLQCRVSELIARPWQKGTTSLTMKRVKP